MRTTRRLIALVALATVVALPASLPAVAQSGSANDITHRQSVRTELSPSGEVDSSRVVTQLTVLGDGPVEVTLPNQATGGLRNLDGFGRPKVEGDQVVFVVDADRDGASERTIADSTAPLPIELEVAYTLDGEPIEPQDLVGRSGEVTASFTARNTTAVPTEIRYFDGRQNPQTETIDVAVPFVGSISMDLDPRFVGIDAPLASVAGDGRGSTRVSWSMVLFAPVGSEEQTVTYSAQVTDAIVPEVVAQFLPVDSNSFGSLGSVQDTFGDVASGLRSLTTGGLIVDGNVKLLAAGAAQLLDGLTQLSDGADALAAGLNETAVPGARQLADGTGAARTGARALADGLNVSAAPGARQLADGLRGSAVPGARQINEGISGIRGGVGAASHTADDGTVIGGLNSLRAGIAALPATAEQGLSAGLRDALNGILRPQLIDGVEAGLADALVNTLRPQLVAGVEDGIATNLNATLQGVLLPALVDKLETDAPGAIADGVSGGLFPLMQGSVNKADPSASTGLAGFIFSLIYSGDPATFVATADAADAAAAGYFNAVRAQGAPALFGQQATAGLVTELEAALPAQLQGLASGFAAGFARGAGVDGDGFNGSLETAFTQFSGAFARGTGVPNSDGFDGSLKGAFDQFAPQFAAGYRQGLDASLEEQALPGFDRLLGGLNNPRCDTANPTDPRNPCGIKQVLELLDAGSSDLTSGLGEAASGAGELATGLVTAGSGANDLANGLVQIDDGTNQLASGLGDAGDGAAQIAEGLDAAEGGGTQIADGTQALTDSGMSMIIEGASDATATPAIAVEHAKAADARGKAGDGLPYGTVDGATASAVYQFELAGIGGPDEGASTPVRAAATLAAFGVAGALGLGLRRRLV